jgi:hypothetical protein
MSILRILCTTVSYVRFQVLTAESMKFRIVFWDVLQYKIIVNRRFRGTCCIHHQGYETQRERVYKLCEAARTSKTSVDNYFTRQYIPEDKSELQQYHSLETAKQSPGSLHSADSLPDLSYCHP